VPNPYWPLTDLRLTTPDLVVRPMTEADVRVLAGRVPEDVEMDPGLPLFPELPRGVGLYQSYWRALAGWRPESWHLPFVVCGRRDGRPLGEQHLEGPDFARRRTVGSFSYLVPGARGRGYGQQMRRAVLTLAFDHLGALAAVTEAWHDNAASIGVSRALGYLPNGERFEARGDGLGVMVAYRLTRERWLASGQAATVTVSGFEPCRPLFGLPA
jgi:RimJ/RimL family protein N-acetyltransferase